MSEEIQAEETAADEESAVEYSVGRILSATRESQGLSVPDVARSLKITVKQVEALEKDEYDKLPGMTFVKGFTRNYAKLLQLDPDALLAKLHGKLLQEPVQAISSRNEGIELSTMAPKVWLWAGLGVLVLVIAAPLLVYELLHSELRLPVQAVNGSTGSVSVASKAPKAAPAPPALTLEVPPPPSPGAAIPSREKADTAVQPLSAAQPESVDVSPAAGGGATIKMVFSKDSWVEIRDKSGARIYSQLNRANTEKVVQGTPPFSLTVGNAANVSITYNGKPVNLAPYINVDVARLTLE